MMTKTARRLFCRGGKYRGGSGTSVAHFRRVFHDTLTSSDNDGAASGTVRPFWSGRRDSNGIRTRDQELGKLLLYQLSYARSLWKANLTTGRAGRGVPYGCQAFSWTSFTNAPLGPSKYAVAKRLTGSVEAM